jgi:hypothetical protein
LLGRTKRGGNEARDARLALGRTYRVKGGASLTLGRTRRGRSAGQEKDARQNRWGKGIATKDKGRRGLIVFYSLYFI